jgi:beta-lactamase class A
MQIKPTRRGFSLMFGSLVAGSALAAVPFPGAADERNAVQEKFDRIEKGLGGRIGVSALDTASGRAWRYRSAERFPMCSTFKALAAAAVLGRVDGGKEDLARRVRFEKKDLVTYSPVTETRAGPEGMTVAEICEAAVTVSDNTAGNLLLNILGGPSGLTRFARSLGDDLTRLDRFETKLNEATPGDPRDTTTPDAMTSNLRALVTANALSPSSREQFVTWLVANKTGDARLRAGLPAGWRVGDKTGTGAHGTVNDIGVAWPPQRAPILVSVYMTETKASLADCNSAIAEVARILTTAAG